MLSIPPDQNAAITRPAVDLRINTASSEEEVHGGQDSPFLILQLSSLAEEKKVMTFCGSFDPNEDREANLPPVPRHNEPGPDDPEPDEETSELLRPIKT